MHKSLLKHCVFYTFYISEKKKKWADLPFNVLGISIRVSFEGLVNPMKTIFFLVLMPLNLFPLIIMKEERKLLSLIYYLHKFLGNS